MKKSVYEWMHKKEVRYEFAKLRKQLVLFTHQLFAIISLIGIICSTALFFIGYHSLDLGHNVLYVKTAYNITLIDNSLGNEIASGMQMYQTGAKQMIIAFALMFVFAYTLGETKRYL